MPKEHKLRPVWRGMKARCYNPKALKYRYYGARGIMVCEEWKSSYRAFYEWAMNNGYADGLTLDRIDVNGNYEPDNCRWVTIAEQNRNKRNNRRLTYGGETKTVSEWSEITGIPHAVIYCRIVTHKWSVESALTTPKGKRRRVSA